jgi:peroxiredoxin
MLPLQTKAPEFSLFNVVSSEMENLNHLKGKSGTLVVFICNHCPYVIHLIDALTETAKEFSKKGVNTIAISSNNTNSHPQDGPEKMRSLAIEKKFAFSYLFDKTQEIAHAYKAACTPDFYLFDTDLSLCYRGRYDDSRPGNDNPITGKDLLNAFNNMLNRGQVKKMQYPSMGCNIKWKEGNSPEERS